MVVAVVAVAVVVIVVVVVVVVVVAVRVAVAVVAMEAGGGLLRVNTRGGRPPPPPTTNRPPARVFLLKCEFAPVQRVDTPPASKAESLRRFRLLPQDDASPGGACPCGRR
jgi:hypothetical protein